MQNSLRDEFSYCKLKLVLVFWLGLSDPRKIHCLIIWDRFCIAHMSFTILFKHQSFTQISGDHLTNAVMTLPLFLSC